MMLLLCHDIHIGFPLVPIMLEAFTNTMSQTFSLHLLSSTSLFL